MVAVYLNIPKPAGELSIPLASLQRLGPYKKWGCKNVLKHLEISVSFSVGWCTRGELFFLFFL